MQRGRQLPPAPLLVLPVSRKLVSAGLLLVRQLRAIGCAAALALARVLALATVVTCLAASLALARVLALTGMLVLRRLFVCCLVSRALILSAERRLHAREQVRSLDSGAGSREQTC